MFSSNKLKKRPRRAKPSHRGLRLLGLVGVTHGSLDSNYVSLMGRLVNQRYTN